MTTEEKAKAYDEALSKCKAYIDDTEKRWSEEFSRATEEVFKEIFPELRESEDERIRTRLIEYFQGFLKGYEDCYKDGGFVRWEGLDVKSIIAWLEKRKEQKPADIDEYKIIKKHITEDSLSSEVNKRLKECGWYVTDEKPAEWDELQADFRNINEAFEDGKKEVVAHPKKYGLCQPAEWSEEDDQLIGFIFDLLNSLVWRKEWAMDKKECLERLKSIRPQYHSHVTMTEAYKMGFEAGKASSWKPSEEQMKVDLGAEIEMEWDSFSKHIAEYGEESDEVVWLNRFSFVDIANYFYELGKNSK